MKTTWNIGVAKLTNAESCSSSRISRPNDVFFFLRKVNPCTVGGGGGTYSAWQMKIFCSDSLSLSRRREFSHFEWWNPPPHCTLVIMSLFGYEQIEFHDDDDEEIDDKSSAGKTFTSLFFFFSSAGESWLPLRVSRISRLFFLSCVCVNQQSLYSPLRGCGISLSHNFFSGNFYFLLISSFFGLLPIFYRVRVCVFINISLSLSFTFVVLWIIRHLRSSALSFALPHNQSRAQDFFFFLFIFISPNFFPLPFYLSRQQILKFHFDLFIFIFFSSVFALFARLNGGASTKISIWQHHYCRKNRPAVNWIFWSLLHCMFCTSTSFF